MADRPTRDPVVTFLGVALLGVGILIATLCGLCTGIGLIVSAFSGREALSSAGIVLAVGALPTAIGVALAWVGRIILRPAPPARSGDVP